LCTSIVDIGDKFIASDNDSCSPSVIDTGKKFIKSVVVTLDHYSKGLLIPAMNLSPVSTTTLIIENPCQRLIAGVVDTGDKFVSSVVDTPNRLPPVPLTPLKNIHLRLSK
jgi:hypothetical protein